MILFKAHYIWQHRCLRQQKMQKKTIYLFFWPIGTQSSKSMQKQNVILGQIRKFHFRKTTFKALVRSVKIWIAKNPDYVILLWQWPSLGKKNKLIKMSFTSHQGHVENHAKITVFCHKWDNISCFAGFRTLNYVYNLATCLSKKKRYVGAQVKPGIQRYS